MKNGLQTSKISIHILLTFRKWIWTLVPVFVFALVRQIQADAIPVPGTIQPLIENCKQIEQALDFLGAPLTKDLRLGLEKARSEKDALKIQDTLDELCLLEIHINPEERVKLVRGKTGANLQQSGYTPFLVKVVNLSTSTRRLRINSPQSGQVYGGMSSLSARRMQRVDLNETKDPTGDLERFLDLEIYSQPPLTDSLTGFLVEYCILLVFTSREGNQAVTFTADIGQGTQDLGFRSECSFLLKSKPAVEVHLKILDDSGGPTAAKLIFKDQSGHVFPPQAQRLAPDFYFQEQVYRANGQSVLLPPGRLQMQSSRGPEYRLQTSVVDIPNTPSYELTVQLNRWINPSAFGFYGGDHHIHGAGCAHYTHPSEGVHPEDMFLQVKGEGLNVGCVLTWGPCFDYQRQFFRPTIDLLSEPLTVMKYDLEISGFGSEALGHVCLLNLKNQDYPGSEGTKFKGWPSWTIPVLRWAKAQGGVTGYAHSASGLQIDPKSESNRLMRLNDSNMDGLLEEKEISNILMPATFGELDLDHDSGITLSELHEKLDQFADQLPNLVIPEMNGVGAMEICVSSVEGVCDFISAMDTARIQEWNMWYHLMNSGFNIKVSGETDFPCMSGNRVGQGRVYAYLGQVEEIDFNDWCRALAAGKSYVSDGFAHAPQFQVNGQSPGFKDVHLQTPGKVKVRASVAFSPETPETVAQGLKLPPGGKRYSGDTVTFHGPPPSKWAAGGIRTVELIVNGEVASEARVPADGQLHDLQWDVNLKQSSWIALRQFPQMHTNPVRVFIKDNPIRTSPKSALWCRETIRKLWENRHNRIHVSERDQAWATYQNAMAVFEQRAAEADEFYP